MMHTLALERGLTQNTELQKAKEWGTRGTVAAGGYRTMDQLTMGVLGMGDIGSR